MTIRERVKEIQRDLRAGNLMPAQVREHELELSGLLGNVLEELREADLAYKTVLLRCLSGEEAANRARIRAEVSPEYQRAREAKDTKELVLEMKRSCKAYLRSLDTEMSLSR